MKRLPNYIRTYRRRAGLSQRHIAILLGSSDQARISRYELNKRRPNVDVVLALEIVLGASVRELFAGRSLQLEQLIRKRAEKLPPRAAEKLFARHPASTAPSVDGEIKSKSRG